MPKLTLQQASIARLNAEAAYAPPIKRSATDSISVKIKREREEESPAPPKKHPRRTLSEQIIIPKLLESSITSPRSPAPERVNRALTDRITHLKEENASLKDSITEAEAERAAFQQRMAKDARAVRSLKAESEQTRIDMMNMRERLTAIELASNKLQGEVESLRERVECAEKDADTAKTELLAVRKGLTKELGEAVKKWGM